MKNFLISILLLCSCSTFSQSNFYEKAWAALDGNKRTEAELILKQAMKDPASSRDAFITDLYLKSYNGKENEATDFISSFYDKVPNPYPYVYALWFNKAVLGGYGKKTSGNQLKFMDQLIQDQKAPGTLVAAANYQKEMHLLFSADFDKTSPYSNAIGSIRNWQFTGPFENLSESGFYKSYGPLEHPEPGAVFKSLTNADVKWFTPANEINDGWIAVNNQFNKSSAVVYAQNFVTSPSNQTVYCNIGFAGAIKVWINDELIISEAKELVTEMDNYSVKYDLKKGINRVLVQLSYTDISYPCFTLRFTDEKYKAIPNITGSAVYSAYNKNLNSNIKYELIPHFAEKYFKDKIVEQPGNMVNYLLLADVYMRSKKLLEARDIMSVAIKQAPENSLLRMKLLEILQKENNRTLLLEEIEKIKQADPESLLVFDLNIKEYYNNEKYEDCANELARRIKLHGEDEFTSGYQILLLIHDNKYEELVKVSEKMYEKYPGNLKLVTLMYNIKKEVYKDKKAGLKIYENYMKNNYDYTTYISYADLLIEQGDIKKGLEIKERLTKIYPYDPNGLYNLSKYYYSAKQYDKAEVYLAKSLALAPYNEKYWEQSGDIKTERNQIADALNAYNQSLKFDPNQYSIISKIRKLNNKPEIQKLFPEIDITKVIKEDNPAEAKNKDYGYYYILDQKDVVIHHDGANEEFITIILKITNDKGVEKYKESSIGYDNSQTLLIEKAEIIKKSQAKIEGERNGNQIVFTNLEAGDVIVFKYRLQNYVYGRFAKEFWDKYYFGGQIYSAITKYNLLAPANQKINYVFTNSSLQPVVKDIEDFKQYSWIFEKPEPIKSEPLMPLLVDAGNILHISTIASWKEISDWYSDVSNNKSEEDFEILALYKKLFPKENQTMTQFQKAKIIYEYIESNIKYSSVSFRQSAYVPQRPSATLTTRLGDCKDLSSLFVTLARMAGINAQMVLVDTRDYGQKDMLLPSIEFNHCIAKAVLDNKSYFIELTDNYLPFTSLPNDLNGAIALEIPSRPGNEKVALVHLKAGNRTKDIIRRIIDIKPSSEGDLNVAVTTIKSGAFSSRVRQTFLHLDNEKQMKEIEKSVAGSYKNNVKLERVSFNDLDKLHDSVKYSYSYKVKNEIAEIGSLNTFRVSYPDVVASLDNFSADKRDYPIEYWSYEDADAYETTVNVTAPVGKKFVELPKEELLSFKDMKFSIQYTLKSPDKLVITRKFSNGRQQQIAPEDYAAFKVFFEKIVKAEQKFIAYK